MDGGPFRMQRPTNRQPVGRPEQLRRPEEPRVAHDAPVAPQPIPVQSSAIHHRSPRRWNMPLLIAAIVLLLGIAGGWLVWSKTQGAATGIDGSKYQAVFFSNGQIYFGKLHPLSDGYMILNDVYYIQSQDNKSSTGSSTTQSTTDQNAQLIKRGSEVHGPADGMVITKDQIQYFENMKDDSKVVQLIDKYKKSQ